jgi:hypothetical protein
LSVREQIADALDLATTRYVRHLARGAGLTSRTLLAALDDVPGTLSDKYLLGTRLVLLPRMVASDGPVPIKAEPALTDAARVARGASLGPRRGRCRRRAADHANRMREDGPNELRRRPSRLRRTSSGARSGRRARRWPNVTESRTFLGVPESATTSGYSVGAGGVRSSPSSGTARAFIRPLHIR